MHCISTKLPSFDFYLTDWNLKSIVDLVRFLPKLLESTIETKKKNPL